MVINGAIVSDLDMMYLESVLQEELALCMMMRSSRTEPPDLTGELRVILRIDKGFFKKAFIFKAQIPRNFVLNNEFFCKRI